MSYKVVEALSLEIKGRDSFFVFPNEEAYNTFDVPFPKLKVLDRVAINGCKRIWTIRNTNTQSTFTQPNGTIWALAKVTISDESGYYASIHRKYIERVLPTKEDEALFHNNGQLSFSFSDW